MSFARAAITALGGKEYIVTRQAKGTYLDGVLVPGALTTVIIFASIQPQKKSRRSESSGNSTEGVYKVFTDTELMTDGALYAADRITYRSETWLVIDAPTWDTFGEIQCEATIARQASP